MIDKSWMLNPQAIRHAKTCIQIIKEQTNKKLKLSQPDFFQRLEESRMSVRSHEFTVAHYGLMSMADQNQNKGALTLLKKLKANIDTTDVKPVDSVEMVPWGGKYYPKSRSGKTFQGLLRGQPLYQ